MPQPFVLPATAGRTDLLAQAHARSTAVGLRAHERPDFSPLSRLALRELLDTNHALFSHARPVMENLHAQIADTQSLVLLTDADGVILHSIGDADFIEKPTASRSARAFRGRKAHAAPTRSAPRSHRARPSPCTATNTSCAPTTS
ncbi:sigma54 specific transcriptional regulator with GAF sensor, Fis family [Burkholderia cepacia]|nr:sigma54 specific transcriptional regulator with GAF sensor, Fis family [Burkholderia cepacia]